MARGLSKFKSGVLPAWFASLVTESAITSAAATGSTEAFLLLRTRFVDYEITAAELMTVEALNRFRSLLFSRHFDETETTRLIRELVTNDIGAQHFARLGKKLTHFFYIGVVGQSTHK